jgi:hypothetical protein
MMHGCEKSDSVIVAVKSPNKTGEPGAEAMERRAGAEENASQQRTRRTQSRESVSQTRSAYGRPQGFAVTIRGGSRMRESRTSGSGRGDQGNPVPYRHRNLAVRTRPGEGPESTHKRPSVTAAHHTREPPPLATGRRRPLPVIRWHSRPSDPVPPTHLRRRNEWCEAASEHLLAILPQSVVADRRWQSKAVADGLALLLQNIVNLLAPELQRRGGFRTAYTGRTLRENLAG